jgi:hypothetical protein
MPWHLLGRVLIVLGRAPFFEGIDFAVARGFPCHGCVFQAMEIPAPRPVEILIYFDRTPNYQKDRRRKINFCFSPSLILLMSNSTFIMLVNSWCGNVGSGGVSCVTARLALSHSPAEMSFVFAGH